MSVVSIPINVVIERPQAKDVVRALLHTVLFHRFFGSVKPQSFDVLDVTFPGVSDPETEDIVNSRVDAFFRALDTIPGGNGVTKKGQACTELVVSFKEKRQKKNYWFSSAEEEVPWEQWVLTIEVLPTRPQNTSYFTRPTFTKQPPPPTPMTEVLMKVLTFVSSNHGREVVPPIVQGGVLSPFPWSIEVKVGDQMM